MFLHKLTENHVDGSNGFVVRDVKFGFGPLLTGRQETNFLVELTSLFPEIVHSFPEVNGRGLGQHHSDVRFDLVVQDSQIRRELLSSVWDVERFEGEQVRNTVVSALPFLELLPKQLEVD